MKNNVFTSYIGNRRFFSKVRNSSLKTNTLKKQYENKEAEVPFEYPLILENTEPEIEAPATEEPTPEIEEPVTEEPTPEIIVHKPKDSLVCKLKDDLCYLYGIVSGINKKFDTVELGIYSTVYKQPIDLDSLITSNTRSYFSESRKVFYIGKNLSYIPGQGIIFSHNSGKFFNGTVLEYSKKTGKLIMEIDFVKGSGTFSSWDVNLTGLQGPEGPEGPEGPTGPIGDIYSSSYNQEIDLDNLNISDIYTYQIDTGLSYTIGQEVIFGFNSLNFFTSLVESYDPDTGDIEVDVQSKTGSGTYSTWEVNISGAPGKQGPTGPTGPIGSAPFYYTKGDGLGDINSTNTDPKSTNIDLTLTPDSVSSVLSIQFGSSFQVSSSGSTDVRHNNIYIYRTIGTNPSSIVYEVTVGPTLSSKTTSQVSYNSGTWTFIDLPNTTDSVKYEVFFSASNGSTIATFVNSTLTLPYLSIQEFS